MSDITKEEKWKPCPFCGSNLLRLLGNPLVEIYGIEMANVYCGVCGGQAPQQHWNTRQSSPEKADNDRCVNHASNPCTCVPGSIQTCRYCSQQDRDDLN
jgi:hypothetical protein